jgi:hypothetical protein
VYLHNLLIANKMGFKKKIVYKKIVPVLECMNCSAVSQPQHQILLLYNNAPGGTWQTRGTSVKMADVPLLPTAARHS